MFPLTVCREATKKMSYSSGIPLAEGYIFENITCIRLRMKPKKGIKSGVTLLENTQLFPGFICFRFTDKLELSCQYEFVLLYNMAIGKLKDIARALAQIVFQDGDNTGSIEALMQSFTYKDIIAVLV